MPMNLIDWLTRHPVDRDRVNEHRQRMLREIAEAAMSRTERTRFDGTPVRDGEWGRRCPEPNCPICVQGRHVKRQANKRERKQGRRDVHR